MRRTLRLHSALSERILLSLTVTTMQRTLSFNNFSRLILQFFLRVAPHFSFCHLLSLFVGRNYFFSIFLWVVLWLLGQAYCPYSCTKRSYWILIYGHSSLRFSFSLYFYFFGLYCTSLVESIRIDRTCISL